MLRMADSSHVSGKISHELARYTKIYKKRFCKKIVDGFGFSNTGVLHPYTCSLLLVNKFVKTGASAGSGRFSWLFVVSNVPLEILGI